MVVLSIITPTRNAAEYLVPTIESVRSQSTADIRIEHIFVDSGSTDGTLDILGEHGCKVIHVPPVNVFYSTNAGMKAATGDAIGYLGGDDLLWPGAAGIVAEWLKHRRHPWMIGSIHWTDAASRSQGKFRPPPSWITPAMHASLRWSCVPAQTVWFTPGFFAELGGFPEDFEYIGDYYCFARAMTISPFDRVTATLATFRRHGRNLSMTAGDARLGELTRIETEFAPETRRRREFYRWLLKLRINAGNPGWMLHKRLGFLPHRPVP